MVNLEVSPSRSRPAKSKTISQGQSVFKMVAASLSMRANSKKDGRMSVAECTSTFRSSGLKAFDHKVHSTSPLRLRISISRSECCEFSGSDTVATMGKKFDRGMGLFGTSGCSMGLEDPGFQVRLQMASASSSCTFHKRQDRSAEAFRIKQIHTNPTSQRMLVINGHGMS